MDVNNAFLNGFLNKEVYVKQPLGFKKEKAPNHLSKLTKALYGLKQALRAWYDRVNKFLFENNFIRKKVDIILFIKNVKHDILIVQIYVNDICKHPFLSSVFFILFSL